jgi:hypothetical protein
MAFGKTVLALYSSRAALEIESPRCVPSCFLALAAPQDIKPTEASITIIGEDRNPSDARGIVWYGMADGRVTLFGTEPCAKM